MVRMGELVTGAAQRLGLIEYRTQDGAVISRAGRVIGQLHTATDGRDVLLNDPDGWEVDQPALWWLGPPGSNGTGGPFGNPIPGADGTQGLTSLGAVARCTSIICDTIAGLPWHVMRGWERLDTPTWVSDPQALRLDGRVISDQVDDSRLSAVDFWAQWITAALWWGNGYVYAPVRDSSGAPKPPLWQLSPQRVSVRDGRYWVDGADEPLPAGSVIHLRGPGPYRKGLGTGVLSRHGAELGLAAIVRGYAADSYNSGVPAGYLKSQQPHMDEPQARALRDKWMAQHGGRRQIAVLNATTEFVPVAVSPIDAQLDSARQWSLRDVALAFGVPPYMLSVPGDSATYANVESRMIELRMFTLLPWMRRLESVLDAQLPAGTSVKIASSGLERADTNARYQAYKVALDAGVLTRDEVRAYEDLPPLGVSADDTLPDDHPGPGTTEPDASPAPTDVATQERN